MNTVIRNILLLLVFAQGSASLDNTTAVLTSPESKSSTPGRLYKTSESTSFPKTSVNDSVQAVTTNTTASTPAQASHTTNTHVETAQIATNVTHNPTTSQHIYLQPSTNSVVDVNIPNSTETVTNISTHKPPVFERTTTPGPNTVHTVPVERTTTYTHSSSSNIEHSATTLRSVSTKSPTTKGTTDSQRKESNALKNILQNIPPGTLHDLLHTLGSIDGSSKESLWAILTAAPFTQLGGTLGKGDISMMSDFLPLINKVIQLLQPMPLTSSDLCTPDVSTMLRNLNSGSLWALKMLDASGKPGKSILKGARHFLGNYDECAEIDELVADTEDLRRIRGSYWRLTFSLPPNITNILVPPDVPAQGRFQVNIQWDFCLPSSCNHSDIADAISYLPLQLVHMNLTKTKEIAMADWREDTSAITAIVIMTILVCLSVVGTVYDVLSEWWAQRDTSGIENKDDDTGGYDNRTFVTDAGKIQHASVKLSMIALKSMNGTRVYPPDEPDSDDDMDDVLAEDNHADPAMTVSSRVSRDSSGLLRQILLSFSVPRNTGKILSTSKSEDNLSCIHGIRVLSMAWVILGHVFWWSQSLKYENPLDFYNGMKTFPMQVILSGSVSVDTFFLISGCLVCYLFLRETKRSSTGKPTIRQMVLYYVHRYWRLTPVYMVVIMLYTCLLPYLIDGPIADEQSLAIPDLCRDNWWINLLYINNIYKRTEACLGWSWFLADDMQYYFIAPLALLPIAFGFTAVGLIVVVFLLLVAIISVAYIEYDLGGATSLNSKAMAYAERIYLTPWCRVAPFAIGLLLGLILSKTKMKMKIPRYVSVMGWQIAVAIGLLCVYARYNDWKDGLPDWPTDTTIAFETIWRLAWSLAVSWVILVCCTGHGGVVNSILSWSPWQPLGRLTYGAYLLHPVLLTYTEFAVRSLVYFNILGISYHFIGTFIISYALSYIASVLVESPCMALEKAVLTKLKMKKL